MSILIATAAYLFLTAAYIDHVVESFRDHRYRASIMALLGLIGYGLLVCHFAIEADHLLPGSVHAVLIVLRPS